MEGVKNVIFFYVLKVIIKNNLIIFVLIVEKKEYIYSSITYKNYKKCWYWYGYKDELPKLLNMLTFLNFSL